MFYALVTFPQTSDIVSSTSPVANSWFQEFLPYALFALGLYLGFYLLRFFIDFIKDELEYFFYDKKIEEEEDRRKAEFFSKTKNYGSAEQQYRLKKGQGHDPWGPEI